MEIRYNNSLGTANMIKTANNFDTFHASRTGPYNFQFNFITGTRGRVRARSFIPHCFVPTNENAIYMYICIYACVFCLCKKKKKFKFIVSFLRFHYRTSIFAIPRHPLPLQFVGKNKYLYVQFDPVPDHFQTEFKNCYISRVEV